MSAAVATTPLSGTSARRNSSSSGVTSSSAISQRRMSGAAPPPAPTSAGGSGPSRSSGGSSSNPTAMRMTSLAQAAAAATAAAEAERAKSRAARSKTATTTASITQKSKPRGARQQRDVMARNRVVRAPTAVDPDDSVYLTIGVLGLKFRCLVQTEWPCEAMIATAIAEYHLAYPKCEIPDFNTIYHMEKGQFLPGAELIGRWCVDNDDIELGITEKPASANGSVASGDRGGPRSLASSASSEDTRETFDFAIMFHRLPLGFTLKQNNENIVVANIYPHSTATHYERLETGVTVVQIADTPLENLGLRQVHDLIKNAIIPLEIHFRGYKKPSLRASLLLAAAKPVAKSEESETPKRRQSVPSPKSEDDNNDSASSSTRARARTTSGTSSGKKVAEQAIPVSDERPAKSPHSNSKQRLTSERRKTNASSPYPEHRTFAAGKRSGRSQRNVQQDKEESELLKSLKICDNQSNHGGDGAARVVTSSIKSNGRREKQSPAKKTRQPSPSPVIDGDNEEPADVRDCDRDSNQNEDETEELLVDQIKTLQIALLKKHEEAKQIARQIELFHEKLSAVRSRNGTEVATNPPPLSSSSSAPISSSHLKLRLTPEVLEAMDSKAGVPPKSASYYQSSNVSSISGYSNYSSRSNAPRSARTARRENMRSDVSVASHSSATSERRHSNPRSPRSQCIKNINNRYSYIPQKYSATSTEAPTSLSSRGAVMSRARATRDSFITKSESPGVGYYDVKLTSHVKGGEIGDSDRALPWP
uniref:PDZ domain-containing protein n=1 Tax=Globisporangium ultimum (strain ATCC 200006 / CBS 805.95 / DAOM BR144) TaxID=431595 RepID=K3WBA3_GLOUD